jgi:E3 ubiquitin-protein ligase CCNP1IP1
VVTTCSHIFCLRCSDELGLSNPKDGHRKCPACSAQLDLLVSVLKSTGEPGHPH